MVKKLLTGLCAGAMCVATVFAAAGCNDKKEDKKPVKIKDGISLTVGQGKSETVDLSQYISVEGTDYTYSVQSSATAVCSVSVTENIATLYGESAGDAVVTATADTVSVEFSVTVTAAAAPLEKEGANKNLSVLKGGQLTVNAADYVDENGVSGVTYELTASSPLTVTPVDSKQFTLTAGDVAEDTSATATLKAGYEGGELTVQINVTVLSEQKPVLKQEAVSKEIDVFTLTDNNTVIDLSENVINDFDLQLTYSAVCANADVTLTVEGTNANVTLGGNYNETAAPVEITVTVNYGEGKSIQYAYTLNILNTSVYRVQNGNFDNDLDGWTLNGEIGEITEEATFWENLPMHNVGKYFRGEVNGKEANTGTLTSAEFKIGGINKISFMLGAGKHDCYVTLEKPDGTVLAIWTNSKFADVGNWNADEIGKTQFALNLVPYVADLSAWAGETVRLVINDEATNDIGFVTFDELVTYYKDAAELPAGAFDAINAIGDKTALKAAIDEAEAITQGDYTDGSFAALTEKIAEANALYAYKGATAEKVNASIAALDAAKDGLTVRVPVQTEAQTTLSVKSGNNTEIDPATYVDDKNLSSVTYGLVSGNTELLTVTENDGKFTVTAGTVTDDTDVTLTLKVYYKGGEVLTVNLTVKVVSGDKPVVNNPEIELPVDIYTLTDKTKIKLNFAGNIGNPANLTLNYKVTQVGQTDELTLDSDNCYEYTFGSGYTDKATEVKFNVVVGSEENNLTVSYVYTLKIKDSTAYRVVNGNFDNGFDGWTMTGDIGVMSNDPVFWTHLENGAGLPVHNDGQYFRGDSVEGNTGTLESSLFTVGGLNKISFKVGAAGSADCYITLEDADGNVLETWRNYMFKDPDDWASAEVGKTQFALNLVTYVADLSAYEGREVKLVLHDNATGGFGFFTFDSLVTYYESADDLPSFDTADLPDAAFVAGQSKPE